jgi:hypothetical protein
LSTGDWALSITPPPNRLHRMPKWQDGREHPSGECEMVANQRRDPILVVQGISDIHLSIEDATMLTKAHVMSLFGQSEAYADPSMPLAPHLMDAKLSLGPTTLIQDGIRRVGRIDRRSLHLGDTAPILPSTAPILVPRSRECLLAATGEHFVEATVMVLHSQRR